MHISRVATVSEHELVLAAEDESIGYRGIIAIHSTRLGPAVGGTRLWPYTTFDEALTDALRLSRGMTYKNAAAGLPLGGGKSVILRPDGELNRELIFRAHGRFVDSLAGRYYTAEDVGSSPADMSLVHQETGFVAGLPELSGDPSPVTAHGVFLALKAAAVQRWGTGDLGGKTVALQGCGSVGYHLARELSQAGANLIVADLNPASAERVVRELGARSVDPSVIHAMDVDIFAPCAMGGVLNARTIAQLRCEIVVGAANNQLLDADDAGRLEARGILYIPDYIANAGGVINGTRELLGWSAERAAARVESIYDTTLEVCRRAARDRSTTAAAADRLAEERILPAAR